MQLFSKRTFVKMTRVMEMFTDGRYEKFLMRAAVVLGVLTLARLVFSSAFLVAIALGVIWLVVYHAVQPVE